MNRRKSCTNTYPLVSLKCCRSLRKPSRSLQYVAGSLSSIRAIVAPRKFPNSGAHTNTHATDMIVSREREPHKIPAIVAAKRGRFDTSEPWACSRLPAIPNSTLLYDRFKCAEHCPNARRTIYRWSTLPDAPFSVYFALIRIIQRLVYT